ncbi:hypothetical protein N8593_01280 [bacterium]|nr:hypothetical protein [Akkermansiaceae bacterium]MDA7664099.1 hypothetical protein [bacterium]MDA7927917.1 hypothetical protein [Akkermansiaceae bacterium]MDB4406342.1 hypothetical protein [bacterium]MDB4418310.1 hypothetical protein [Akkermansiaceae bacterium]
MKAGFQQQDYDANGAPLRSKLIANFTTSQRLASRIPWAWNFLFGKEPIRRILNKVTGFHPDRTIPLLPKQTLERWFKNHSPRRGLSTLQLFDAIRSRNLIAR